jgi:excisionase family DNA binding protein
MPMLIQTPEPPESDDQFVVLNFQEVCQLLRVKPSRLYYLTSTKGIPCYKVGGSLRFERSEVLHWFKRHRKAPR